MVILETIDCEAFLGRDPLLRGVMDALPQPVAVLDHAGVVIAINRSWEHFALESSASPFFGFIGVSYVKTCRIAAATDVFALRAFSGLNDILSGERLEFSLEYPRLTADGDRWFMMSAARVDVASAAVVVSHADITDRRTSELASRHAERRRDEFLATLAHELRNPLTPIRNAVHVLRLKANEPAHQVRDRDLLAMVERQVGHLVRLVDDLMEASRITRGMIELKKERLDLIANLNHVIETSRSIVQSDGRALRVDFPSGPVILDADPVRLAQVFTNLLDNAAKYTCKAGDISISVTRDEHDAVISVCDSGAGIPAEMLPRVFDLFSRVDQDLGRAQGGLGVGLALVRSLVEMHGGSIEADSAGVGRGAAFIVRLPLATDYGRDKTLEKAPVSNSKLSRRILVIDDDRDVADSFAMFLETLGATVRVAYSGRAGLNVLDEFDPELVFLDLGMPRMDGYETARQIRSRPESRTLPLVALTGWGQEQVCARVRAAGFDHQLTKPANLDALQNLLATLGE